ncbi:hypothetical protein L195_g051653, partial [Trifolium pratense]
GVAKIQEADSTEGKLHGTTNPSLAEKQEFEKPWEDTILFAFLFYENAIS